MRIDLNYTKTRFGLDWTVVTYEYADNKKDPMLYPFLFFINGKALKDLFQFITFHHVGTNIQQVRISPAWLESPAAI